MTDSPTAPREADWPRFEEILDQLVELEPAAAAAALSRPPLSGDPLRDRLAAALAAADAEGAFTEPAAERWAPLLAGPEEEPWAGAGAGALLGRWRLGDELGRGGMGTVYAAERADGAFEQRAAVKIVRRGFDDESSRVRFRRERQILARLEHPAIARLLDGGVAPDGRPFLVLERVDGEPITVACDRRRLPVEDRLRLFLTVLEAVDHAHRHLIVHRDLKPSNVLLASSGEVKLLDFGVAKLLADDGETELTRSRSGTPLTPQYAAPEQITGEPVTTATDIYALGLLLFELLTGQRPYRLASGSALELERQIVTARPPAPSAAARGSGETAAARSISAERLARRLSGELDAIVLKALARDPERRYGSAAAFARDIARHLAGEPIEARPDSLADRTRRFVARHPIGVAAASAIALLLVASLAFLLLALRASRARLVEAERAAAIQGFLVELFEEADPKRDRGQQLTVREVLDAGARRLETELGDQPEIRQALLATLGTLYLDLGIRDRALVMLDAALELAERHRGERGRVLVDALLRRASLDYWADRFPAALALQERALGILRADPRGRDAELTRALRDSGGTLRLLGRLPEAEARQREALELDRRAHGDGSLEAAEGRVGLALTMHRADRDEEALALAEQALAAQRRALPSDHPDLAATLEVAGLALTALGRAAEAEAPLREVLTIRRQAYGPEHPQVLEAVNSLASGLEGEGKFAEAIELRREAVAIARRVLGPGESSLGAQINNLGFVCFRMADFECAADSFREALDIWLVSDGPRQPGVATARNNLGAVLLRLDRPAEALPELRIALELRREQAGEQSQPVAQTLRLTGLAELALGRLDDAAASLDRALALSRELYAARHPRLAEALVSHAQLRLAQGRHAEARDELEEALAVRLEQFGAESPLVAEVRTELERAVAGARR